MEYRKLPHGTENISVLGIGMGGIQDCPDEEIEKTVAAAIEHGVNFFDLCAGGKNVYEPFGRAMEGKRDKIYLQVHFGAVYNSKGEYAWSRNFTEIKETFDWELKALGTDYVDMGFLHCVDQEEDYDELVRIGVFDYIKELKAEGIVRHIGFSSHTPLVANRILDTGLIDMMMFSINPAYDLEQGDEYGIGTNAERAALFRRCEAEGVGISVMKPFHGGKLLSAKSSPFGQELSRYQCLQYALDRPGVLTCVPGVRNYEDLEALIGFAESAEEEKDYSVIGSFTSEKIRGNCVYCNHCQPCPAGIDIGLVNKYYDLSAEGDQMATDHYRKLQIKADACLHCGHCDGRCPFGVAQGARMAAIADYFA
ncbi:MAG: aldo/keto reductase [Lachnospiraceae bacterium]|nr:aldo/keto reductase [Lachnospiraceae bacterium]